MSGNSLMSLCTEIFKTMRAAKQMNVKPLVRQTTHEGCRMVQRNKTLSEFAKSQPQAAYAAFCFG